MSKKANFFAIGIFVVTASLIAVMILIFFGSSKFRKHTVPVLVTFQGSTNGLMKGSKVKTYGVEIGSVTDIMIHKLPGSDEVVIPVLIEIDTDKLLNLMGAGNSDRIDNNKIVKSMIDSGGYAKLGMESIVTGQLFVEIQLGIKDDGYVLESERFGDYLSLPTVPTELQLMMASLQSIMTNLGSTDFKGMIEETKLTIGEFRTELQGFEIQNMGENLNGLLADTRTLVNNPHLKEAIGDLNQVLGSLKDFTESLDKNEDGLLERLDQSMDQLEGTLQELELASSHVRNWLDPSNAVYQEVVTVLDQLGDLSRALRVLIEYTERNPNAFITGRSQEESKP